MGLFLRWMALRESNSRKRRIKAALRGEQPPLPGSYAANPRTDVDAMDVADKSGVVRKKYMCKCGCGGDSSKCTCPPDCSCRKYHEEHSPDYSIDRWIDMANDLGDDLSVLNRDSEEKEKELDKDIKTKKKETEKEKAKADKPDTEEDADKDEEELWKKIQKHLNKSDQASSKEPADSSEHSPR